MNERHKLQVLAGDLRKIASGLYDAGLKPGVAGNDAMTLAALKLWRLAEAAEEIVRPPERARAGLFRRLIIRWRRPLYS